MSGPLVLGKEAPAKIHGVLTVKQKPVERVADAKVMYLKLTPEQAEAQKRFGFASDNVKVKAEFATTFTDHGMPVPPPQTSELRRDEFAVPNLSFEDAHLAGEPAGTGDHLLGNGRVVELDIASDFEGDETRLRWSRAPGTSSGGRPAARRRGAHPVGSWRSRASLRGLPAGRCPSSRPRPLARGRRRHPRPSSG